VEVGSERKVVGGEREAHSDKEERERREEEKSVGEDGSLKERGKFWSAPPFGVSWRL
jgi:hypothetical protein